MAITIKGSSFYFGDQVDATDGSFDNFFHWLKTIATPEKQWPYQRKSEDNPDYKRALYFDFNDNYWYGVFLSAKTNQFQHFVKNIDGKIIVEAKAVGDNPPVDMNFFCIRQDSCKGIFSHYSGSYQFNTFVKELWALYRFYIESLKAPIIKAIEETTSSQAKKDKINLLKQFSFKDKCRSGALFDPKSFNQVLDSITKLDIVRLTTYETNDADDEPISTRIRNIHKSYRFSLNEEIDSKVRNWIKDMRVRSSKPTKSGEKSFTGSVIGFDANDREVYLNFGKTMKDFLDFNYDDLGTFAVDDIFSHDIIKEMVSRMDDSIVFRPGRIDD